MQLCFFKIIFYVSGKRLAFLSVNLCCFLLIREAQHRLWLAGSCILMAMFSSGYIIIIGVSGGPCVLGTESFLGTWNLGTCGLILWNVLCFLLCMRWIYKVETYVWCVSKFYGVTQQGLKLFQRLGGTQTSLVSLGLFVTIVTCERKEDWMITGVEWLSRNTV